MRKCNICGETKPLEAFNRDRTKSGGRGFRCKICDAKKASKQAKERRSAVKEYADEARLRPCVVCNIAEPEVIQFHHLEEKGKRWHKNQPIEHSKAELRKCVPICANCHLRVHAGTATIPVDAKRVGE